jgi:Spy/CpxP family protein refolding chaperone
MNRFRWMMAAALVAALGAGSVAFAQGPRGGGPGRPGGPGGRGLMGGLPLASLNLTQAQQDLIRDIRERSRGEMSQIDAKLRQAHVAQRKAVSTIPLNEGAIRAATLAVAEVQADTAILQARVQNEIFAALTSEQQEQVKKALAEREQRLVERQANGQRRRESRQQAR